MCACVGGGTSDFRAIALFLEWYYSTIGDTESEWLSGYYRYISIMRDGLTHALKCARMCVSYARM